MFAKLLKHEFKSSRSILGLLTMICLGVAVVAALALKLMIVSAESTTMGMEGAAALMLVAMPLLVMAFLGILAYGVAAEILLLVQFYKRKFTDEGYLTFTLPTNVHNIYLSSLANILIWQLISIVTIFASFAIIILFGTSPDKFINTDFFNADFGELKMALEIAFDGIGWDGMDTVQTIIRFIINFISAAVLATTCIATGATIAKKHKALAAVGIYFGMSYVLSGITSVISLMAAIGANDLGGLMSTSNLMTTVVNLVIIVGGYFLTTYFMRSKLNLP